MNKIICLLIILTISGCALSTIEPYKKSVIKPVGKPEPARKSVFESIMKPIEKPAPVVEKEEVEDIKAEKEEAEDIK